MKFGKVEDISKIDFSLPVEPAANSAVLNGLEAKEASIYIGCTGWGMKEWKGRYYPSKTRATDFLTEYGKQFNTIELNSTHYGTPAISTLTKWRDETPDDFVFCPKIHKAISHRKTLGTDSDIIENTVNALSTLGDKLGPCFMQLPPYFGADRLEILRTFFEVFPPEIDLSVELRHPSWYEGNATDEVHDLAVTYGRSLLITDVAGRRDVLHMRVCGSYLMVRFVGNATETELHLTDYQRVDDWIGRIKYYIDQGVSEIYFFPHEPDNLLAPDLAEYICQRVADLPNTTVRGPKKILSGEQLNLF